MKLLGLTGRAGVGKDTVGKILYREHGFHCLAFADPLRAMIWAGLDLSHQEVTDRDLKELPLDWLGKSPRQLLQTLGTEWGRNLVHPDLWLILCRRKLTRMLQKGIDAFVITDVRFNNEAEFIRSMGGRVVHIFRDVPAVSAHASEAGVTHHFRDDLMLPNYDDLDHLADKVRLLVEGLA